MIVIGHTFNKNKEKNELFRYVDLKLCIISKS